MSFDNNISQQNWSLLQTFHYSWTSDQWRLSGKLFGLLYRTQPRIKIYLTSRPNYSHILNLLWLHGHLTSGKNYWLTFTVAEFIFHLGLDEIYILRYTGQYFQYDAFDTKALVTPRENVLQWRVDNLLLACDKLTCNGIFRKIIYNDRSSILWWFWRKFK